MSEKIKNNTDRGRGREREKRGEEGRERKKGAEGGRDRETVCDITRKTAPAAGGAPQLSGHYLLQTEKQYFKNCFGIFKV